MFTKKEEIQNAINQTLAQIETLSKQARFTTVDLDKTAREIITHADYLKHLAYKLSMENNVIAEAI